MTPEQERQLIQFKAWIYDELILRHPGHANQKTHGNRFGAGQAKESLRRLKDDKAAREQYKDTHRKKQVFGGSSSDYSQDYHAAKTELKQAKKAMGNTPESEWGELDRDFINDAKSRVQEELELSRVAKDAGYTPGKMTKEQWGTLAGRMKDEANDNLRHSFEAGRQSAGDKLRGQKDVWMQVGGQAVLTHSGRSKREAQDLVSRIGKETKNEADEFMGQNLAKLGYSKSTVDNLDYNQKRRLLAEIGHGQTQSGSIGNLSTAERRQIINSTSQPDRMNARSTAMNPRAGKGMEQWTYYEQAAIKAGQTPDLIPDYLMDIDTLPDYVRYPGGKNPYKRQRVEEIDF